MYGDSSIWTSEDQVYSHLDWLEKELRSNSFFWILDNFHRLSRFIYPKNILICDLVSCCDKVLFENHASRNGFYGKNGTSISTGPIYMDADEDQILYYERIKVDSINHFGWVVGPSVGLTALSNLVNIDLQSHLKLPFLN